MCENAGEIRWRSSEVCSERCGRNTIESVTMYQSAIGIRWRVSEEYDGECWSNTMESVGGI